MSWAFTPGGYSGGASAGPFYDGVTSIMAADYKAIAHDIQTWGGNVDAGANGLTNVAWLKYNPASLPGTPAAGQVAVDSNGLFRVYQSGPAAWSLTWNAVPTLQNSWTNFGAGYNTPQYSLDPTGIVRIRGTIQSGTTADGTLLFTMPSGFRPPAHVGYIQSGGSVSGQVVQVNVFSDGTVKVYGWSGGAGDIHMNIQYSIST